METKAFLDTHVLIWLFETDLERISALAQEKIDQVNLLYVSPMTLLELDFLFEIKKIEKKSQQIFSNLQEKLDLEIPKDSFNEIISEAGRLHWTQDPFDRILVAHAQFHHAFLISKDREIQKHYSRCIW